MYHIGRKVIINASPEKVFDLISAVADFSRYSTYIKEVKEISKGKYLWRVELFGIRLEWEATVSESKRPERFAWKSDKGPYNTGTYELKPLDNGTEVSFNMEYSLTGNVLEAFIAPLLTNIISIVAGEFLEKVKKELEGQK